MAQSGQSSPRLLATLRDDIKRRKFFADMKREAREIEEFYLTGEERDRLSQKRKFWRWLVLAWWVLKNSILKLTPFRRILLVAGLILVITNVSVESDGAQFVLHYHSIGAFALLVIILLELKDKLLAQVELKSGRDVQRAMSPEPTPDVPGWNLWLYSRPANEVGGDIVDFLRLDGGRFGIAIGDVAGKGLGAALFMVKIQSTLRALAPESESLSDLASKLNAILIRDGIPGRFASLIFVRLEKENGDLRLFNAGHMPPLVVSADGVTELARGNAALGLSVETHFEARNVTVGRGQVVVIYSDGLTEAQNEEGDFYGLDRLKALCAGGMSLAPQSLGERILDAVSAFEGDAPRRDDLSLAILQKSA